MGGTTSKVSGGKFANGGTTATLGHLFNQLGSLRDLMKRYEGQSFEDQDVREVLKFFIGDQLKEIGNWSVARDVALDMHVKALEADDAYLFALDTSLEQLIPYSKVSVGRLSGEALSELAEGNLADATFSKRLKSYIQIKIHGPAKTRTQQLKRLSFPPATRSQIRGLFKHKLEEIHDK